MPPWVIVVTVLAGLWILAYQDHGSIVRADESESADGPDDAQTVIMDIGPRTGVLDLAKAIAKAEGFGVPNARPTRQHNPGDLTLAGTIRTFPSDYSGWSHLYGQLEWIRDGHSKYYDPTMTFAAMSRQWTETAQAEWARIVIRHLRSRGHLVTLDTPIGVVLNV